MALAIQTGNAQLDQAVYRGAKHQLSRRYHFTDHGSPAEVGLIEIVFLGEGELDPPSVLTPEGRSQGWLTYWDAIPDSGKVPSKKILSQILGHPIWILMRTTLPNKKDPTIVNIQVRLNDYRGTGVAYTPAFINDLAEVWMSQLMRSLN